LRFYPTGLFAVTNAFRRFTLLSALLGAVLTGCSSYRLGGPNRQLPGGYSQIHIPVFTNALIQEFERSRSARVVASEYAEAQVQGEIQSVLYQPGGIQGGDRFPKGSVLASEYRVLMTVKVSLKRMADNAELWTGTFQGERTYVAPQVLQAGINTVNPLYNLSARRQNIENMANDLMSEAHDRMSESF
jgi:hypothetical protein